MRQHRNWRIYNQRLVGRGKPSTYLKGIIQDGKGDLCRMNDGKVGAPYEYSPTAIISAFAIKTVGKNGYRQAAAGPRCTRKL